MSFLSAIQDKLGSFQDELGKLKGKKANKDILEAAIAGCIIVGASDGTYSDKEKDETVDTLLASKFIEATGFTAADIGDIASKYTSYRPASRGGRERLMEEIREAGRRPETATFAKAIFMSWIDIAEAEDGIDDKEKSALIECGEALGLRNAASLI